MCFYQILQSIMDDKKISIPDVARLSGLTDSTVRSILTRKNKTVALDVAFKLSKGLDVSLQRLNGEPETSCSISNAALNEPKGYALLNEDSKKIVDNLVTQLLGLHSKKEKQ